MNDRPPRLKDIAEACGVSAMTVSKALRGEKKVAESTRKKILKEAERIGYRPDPVTSRLMSRLRWRRGDGKASGSVLAWLTLTGVPQSEDPHYFRNKLKAGAQSRAEKLGYQIEPFALNDAKMRPERLRQILQTRGIEAIILPPFPRDHHTFPMDLKPFANATIGFSLSEPALHRVAHNEFSNTYQALLRAYKLGYRKPALLYSMSLDQPILRQAIGAWHAFLLEQKLSESIAPRIETNITNQATSRWLKTQAPDVVICNSNVHAWLCDKKGANLPNVGFVCTGLDPDNIEPSGMIRDWKSLGAAAVDMVVAQLHRNEKGYPTERKTMLIHGKWNQGNTLPVKA